MSDTPKRPPPPPRPGAPVPPRARPIIAPPGVGSPPRKMTPTHGTPRPPPVPPSPRIDVPQPPAPAFTAAPIPIRDVMPTLAEQEPSRSPTLRPVGATPPPPRSLPQAKVPTFDVLPGMKIETAIKTEIEIAAGTGERLPVVPGIVFDPAVKAAPSPFAVQPTPGRAVTPLPVGPPALPSSPVAQVPPPPAAVIAAAAERLPPVAFPAARAASPEPKAAVPPPLSGPPRRAPSTGRSTGPSRNAITVATAGSVLIPGTLLLVAALLKPGSPAPDDARTPGAMRLPASAASAELAPAISTSAGRQGKSKEAPVTSGCTAENPATRLAESVFASAPVVVAAVPGGAGAAIGFAGAKDRAVGLTLDPEQLAPTRHLDKELPGGALLGVVPLVHGAKLDFAADVADPTFASRRTVSTRSPFSIGVTPEGLARSLGNELTMIWPGSSADPTITTPRIASVQGEGHAVTFRHGGASGKVLVGWLDEAGSRRTDLSAVETDSTVLGTPAVGANDRAVLVAFAAKATADAPYRVELSTALHGEPPVKARAFEIPPGGPGGEAIAPVAEGLSSGRFLLQWTEGSAGNRAVRAQALSGDLVPLGEPATLSTPEQNAGQGTLWVSGQRAIAIFLVKGATSHELWGASLRCP